MEFCCILCLLLLSSSASLMASSGDVETYIVHVLPKSNSSFRSARERIAWHESLLPDKSRLVYSYGKIMSGFAARLSRDELAALKLVEGFLQAVPDRTLSLQTTHSPAFLGLRANASPGLWKDSRFGEGVIVGMLDTGIKVGHPSFSDNGLLPKPPSKWKGSCKFNASDCSNKLIGARAFLNGKQDLPPYDDNGHGTHTASTAAGMFVGGANVDGQAKGTAAGLAPYAHLAVYKVCDSGGFCITSDILAGLDQAVEDGVDVLSISLGDDRNVLVPFYQDPVAVGTFGAVEQGVFVSCSAGNMGPASKSMSNEAPWMLSVGASSIDRLLEGTLYLNNGPTLIGQTLYQPANFSFAYYPLVYPGGIAGTVDAQFCLSLKGINVTGKVVLCDRGYIGRVTKGINVKNAGGVGMILANLRIQGDTTLSEAHILPALHISYADGVQVKSYIHTETSPMAAIAFNGTILGTTPAPVVADFSSRGPNKQADILKPDIIGPGLNILAAWPFQVGEPTASSTFNVLSGTSMAAPHLSGVASLLRRLHPDWSPAAMKSAIMTSADVVGNDGSRIRDENLHAANLFAIGAGHVNASKVANPGFVYDIEPGSYIAYLCTALQYNDTQISIIAQKNTTCSGYVTRYGEELNYPSFMVRLSAANAFTAVASRNVTNVGEAISSYTVEVSSRKKVSISVDPETLSFTKANQVLQYTVTFSINANISNSDYFQGYVRWISSDGIVTVASPVIVAVDI